MNRTKECIECSQNCDRCFGVLENECLKCKENYFLFENQVRDSNEQFFTAFDLKNNMNLFYLLLTIKKKKRNQYSCINFFFFIFYSIKVSGPVSERVLRIREDLYLMSARILWTLL